LGEWASIEVEREAHGAIYSFRGNTSCPDGSISDQKKTGLRESWISDLCKKLGITIIGTHGLRHSTPALYISHGATRDDVRKLLGHSTLAVTDRYIHGGSNLDNVAQKLTLVLGGTS